MPQQFNNRDVDFHTGKLRFYGNGVGRMSVVMQVRLIYQFTVEPKRKLKRLAFRRRKPNAFYLIVVDQAVFPSKNVADILRFF